MNAIKPITNTRGLQKVNMQITDQIEHQVNTLTRYIQYTQQRSMKRDEIFSHKLRFDGFAILGKSLESKPVMVH